MFDEIIRIAEEHGVEAVILFGSRAKGTEKDTSDIDICIISEAQSKRRLAAAISAEIDYDLPVDILVYTPSEWSECIADETSFAYKILKEGRILYGQPKVL